MQPNFVVVLTMFVMFSALIVAPIVIVATSRRVRPDRKALWVLITLIGSWLGLLAFFLANPKQEQTS